MMRVLFLLMTLFVFCDSLYAQEREEYELPPQGRDEYRHCCNGLHKSEIGIANSPVYSFSEKEINYSFHIHYIHSIGDSPYGLGLGYKQIFDDQQHQIFSVVGSYRTCNWSYNISPGFTFEDAEGGDSNLLFAINLEAGYELDFGDFHLGPYGEVSYFSKDVQLGVGLRLGYGF